VVVAVIRRGVFELAGYEMAGMFCASRRKRGRSSALAKYRQARAWRRQRVVGVRRVRAVVVPAR